MSNPRKAQGTAFETRVARWLRDTWPAVERRALDGAGDRGDIAGVPNTVIECKSGKNLRLSEWVIETEDEAITDGAEWWAMVHRRRGYVDTGDQYATMTLRQFANMIARLHDLEQPR